MVKQIVDGVTCMSVNENRIAPTFDKDELKYIRFQLKSASTGLNEMERTVYQPHPRKPRAKTRYIDEFEIPFSIWRNHYPDDATEEIICINKNGFLQTDFFWLHDFKLLNWRELV